MDKKPNKHGLTVLPGKSREERIAETKEVLMGNPYGDDIYDFLLENIHDALDHHVQNQTLTFDALSEYTLVYIGFVKGIIASDVANLDIDKAIDLLDKTVNKEYLQYVNENEEHELQEQYDAKNNNEFFVAVRELVKDTINSRMSFQVRCLVQAIGEKVKKRWKTGEEYDEDAELTYKEFRKAVHWKGNLPLNKATAFCDTLMQWRCIMQDPETGEVYCTSIINSYRISYDPKNGNYKFFFTFSEDVFDVFAHEAVGEMLKEERATENDEENKE